MRCGWRPRLLADEGLNSAFMGISFVLVRLTGKDGLLQAYPGREGSDGCRRPERGARDIVGAGRRRATAHHRVTASLYSPSDP